MAGQVRPHVLVVMKVRYRPHLAGVCGLARTTHNFAEGLEAVEGRMRKGIAAITQPQPMWAKSSPSTTSSSSRNGGDQGSPTLTRRQDTMGKPLAQGPLVLGLWKHTKNGRIRILCTWPPDRVLGNSRNMASRVKGTWRGWVTLRQGLRRHFSGSLGMPCWDG